MKPLYLTAADLRKGDSVDLGGGMVYRVRSVRGRGRNARARLERRWGPRGNRQCEAVVAGGVFLATSVTRVVEKSANALQK